MEGTRELAVLVRMEPDRDFSHARLFPQSSIRAGLPLHLDRRPDCVSPALSQEDTATMAAFICSGVAWIEKDGYLLPIGLDLRSPTASTNRAPGGFRLAGALLLYAYAWNPSIRA